MGFIFISGTLSSCAPVIFGISTLGIGGAGDQSLVEQLTSFSLNSSSVAITNVVDIIPVGNRLYAIAQTAGGVNTKKLYVSTDGTNFTLASNIRPGSGDPIGNYVVVNDTLYFICTLTNGSGLFKHGPADDAVVASDNILSGVSGAENLAAVGNDLYVIGTDTQIYRLASGQNQITTANKVSNHPAGTVDLFLGGANTFYYVRKIGLALYNARLYKYTPGDPVVTDADTLTTTDLSINVFGIDKMVEMGGTLYFVATAASTGAPTLLGYTPGDPVFNGTVDADSIFNRSLNLRSNASVDGINNFEELIAVDDVLYFTAIRAGGGIRFLFKYVPGDPVIGYNSGSRVSTTIGYTSNLKGVGDTLYFFASTGAAASGNLYKYKLGDPAPAPADGLTSLGWAASNIPANYFQSPANYGDTTLYFIGESGAGLKLMKYDDLDPLITGADILSNIYVGSDYVPTGKLTQFGNAVYFLAKNIAGAAPTHLYRYSAGDPVITSADEITFTQTQNTTGPLTMSKTVTAGDSLYFVGSTDQKLFKYQIGNSIISEPQAISNTNPGGSDGVDHLAALTDGSVVFSAIDNSGHRKLYRHAGSGVITSGMALSDTSAGGDDEIASVHALLNGSAIFTANNNAGDYKIYKYSPGDPLITSGMNITDTYSGGNDGAAGGTGVLNVLGKLTDGSFYFFSQDDTNHKKFFFYEWGQPLLTSAGVLQDVNPGADETSWQYELTSTEKFFFVGSDDHVYLHQSGDPAPTQVSDINMGAGDMIQSFIAKGDNVFFTAFDFTSACGFAERLFYYTAGVSAQVTSADITTNIDGMGCDWIDDPIISGDDNDVYFKSLGKAYRYVAGAAAVPAGAEIADPDGTGLGVVNHMAFYEGALYLVADPLNNMAEAVLYQYTPGGAKVTARFPSDYTYVQSLESYSGGLIVQDLGTWYTLALPSGISTSYGGTYPTPSSVITIGSSSFRYSSTAVYQTKNSAETSIYSASAVSGIQSFNNSLLIFSDPCGGDIYSCQTIYRYRP